MRCNGSTSSRVTWSGDVSGLVSVEVHRSGHGGTH